MMFPLTSWLAFAAILIPTMAVPNSTTHQLRARDIKDVCTPNGRTAEAWKQYGLDDWFYIESVVEGPDMGKPGVSWTKSISQAISGMAYDLYDFQCIPGDTCIVNPAASVCEISPEAYFVLKAMANLNNFLNSMANTVLSAQADITDSTGNMVKLFTTVGSTPPSATSAISIVSCILGVIGAFIPEVAPVAGAESGILGIFVGAMGLISSTTDIALTEFPDFAGAQAILGSVSDAIKTGLYQYSNTMLNVPPQARWEVWRYDNDPTSLVNLFSKGAFAEPINIISSDVPDTVHSMLASPVINYLWDSDKVFIAKISDKSSVDVCSAGIYSSGHSFCDDSRVMHTFYKWDLSVKFIMSSPLDTGNMPLVKGYNELSQYKTSIQDIDAAASYWQGLSGYQSTPDPTDVQNTLTSSMTPDVSKLLYFTMPVCDVDALLTDSATDYLKDCQSNNFDIGRCIEIVTACLCADQTVADKNWPWELPTGANCDFSTI